MALKTLGSPNPHCICCFIRFWLFPRQLPEEGVKWRTKEEAAREAAARAEQSLEPDPDLVKIALEENVLIAPQRYLQAVSALLWLIA